MNQKTMLSLQVLEKLGAPLMAAVGEVSARENPAGRDPKAEAQRMAGLLAKAVQASISLGKAMDLRDDDGQADSVRLALAALAGSLIAGQYRITGRIPEDAELDRVLGALQAVLAFADNFSPAADTVARLRAMDPGMVPYDENQVGVLYFNTLVPVIEAVAGFSFGRPDKKLAQEIAARLGRRAEALRESLFGPAPDPQTARQSELSLLGALVSIYHSCHQAETERVLAMDEAARMQAAQNNGGVLPMDPVWDAFELRVAMLEALAAGSAAAPAPMAAAARPPASPLQAPSAPPMVEAAPLAATPPAGGGGSPMAFFKPGAKKASGEEKTE